MKYGLGMAIAQQGSGLPNIDMASATLRLNDDGFFTLLTGSTDIGTGSDTAMAQIAAEILEVPLDRIIVHAADTDTTPYDSGAYASSTTYTTGNAVIDAANKMVEAIKATGGQYLSCAPEDVTYSEGLIKCRTTGESVDLVTFSNKLFTTPSTPNSQSQAPLFQRKQHHLIWLVLLKYASTLSQVKPQ